MPTSASAPRGPGAGAGVGGFGMTIGEVGADDDDHLGFGTGVGAGDARPLSATDLRSFRAGGSAGGTPRMRGSSPSSIASPTTPRFTLDSIAGQRGRTTPRAGK